MGKLEIIMNKDVRQRFNLLIKSPFYQRLSPMKKILSKVEFINCPDNDFISIRYYTVY